MFEDRRNNGILGITESIFDFIGWLLYILIWVPITWVFSLLAHFVKDVATGVYGKIVQLTVVFIFGLLVYFLQSHLK
jgi:hypothetical protein